MQVIIKNAYGAIMFDRLKFKIVNLIIVCILIVLIFHSILYELNCIQIFSPITAWTIVLALVTLYYAYTTSQILEEQSNSEKVKWFQQIFLSIKPVSMVADKCLLLGFSIRFSNISTGIAMDCKLRIFEGDSLLEFKETNSEQALNIGAIPTEIMIPIELEAILKNPINIHEKTSRTFRIHLEYTNPLKVYNGLYYIMTCRAESREKLSCTVRLIDFDNGVSMPDLNKFREMAKQNV